jgi:coniferyl-aldehyde dehydrogenase
MGAYHGHDGFKTFSHAKAVFKQVNKDLTAMVRPPYGEKIQKMLAGAIKR